MVNFTVANNESDFLTMKVSDLHPLVRGVRVNFNLSIIGAAEKKLP